MNRQFRFAAATALLLFTCWILSFKTIHIMGHADHHDHGCDHAHDSAPEEDAEECFVCNWTFAIFDRIHEVTLPAEVELPLTGYAFGYTSPFAEHFSADTQNKAPPIF